MPLFRSSYGSFHCLHCKVNQKVYIGDPEDQTLPDVEAVQCFNCGMIELIMPEEDVAMTHGLDEPLTTEMIQEHCYIEKGEKL